MFVFAYNGICGDLIRCRNWQLQQVLKVQFPQWWPDACSKDSLYSERKPSNFFISLLMNVLGLFIYLFTYLLTYLQRACSFGGFDLTNRSVHAVICDNDNTVRNSSFVILPEFP